MAGTRRKEVKKDSGDKDRKNDVDNDEMEIATLPVQEQMFHYVSNGNITKLTFLLEQRDETGLDIDLQNSDGLTPLGIAIREGFLIVVYRLLDHDARIGDALLRAVDSDFQQAVTVLLEYALEQVPEVRDSVLKCQCETNDMHPDVTPIVRAAQKNNFTLVKVLYDIGLRIPDIKMSSFEYSATDSLQRSVGTLEIYKGLASPAYVCFSTSDPIGRAFKLCATLHKVGDMEVEFNNSYVQLADIMEQLAADLVSYARTTEEIMTILTYNGKAKYDRSMGLFPTINRAITYEQKKFVAQPNCQQAVRAAFYQRLLWLNDKPPPLRFLIQFLIILCYPILSIIYKLGISDWCDSFVKIPAVQFLMQLGSDVTLLTMVLCEVLGSFGQREESYMYYVPALYFFAFLYALGMLWREILYMYHKGSAETLKSTSHIANLFIATLLVVVFGIHVITFLFYHPEEPESTADPPLTVPKAAEPTATPIDFVENLHPSLNTTLIQGFVYDVYGEVKRELEKAKIELDEHTSRHVQNLIFDFIKPTFVQQGILQPDFTQKVHSTVISRGELLKFKWFSSMLISRAFMAMAAVISFTRIQPYLVSNDDVGPLQISLKSMLLTTSRFGFVVITVLIAFACGLTFIYGDTYTNSKYKNECKNAAGLKRGGSCSDENYFESIIQSIFSLYWSLFGLMPREAVQSNTIPRVLESAGTLLYASFYIFTVVVLLNALIAVMSNVYNQVEENADSEWKFNRTSLWMTFLDETFHVPPPFNLLPRMRSVGLCIREKTSCIRPSRNVLPTNLCRCCKTRKKSRCIRVPLADEVELDGIITQAEANQTAVDTYKRVMAKIVDRYIVDRTSHERNLEGDISIADLRNLKNDVVGLRYELFKKLWNVNEKLEQHSSESGEIRQEMTHVNNVFDSLSKNKDELETYREEADRLQELLKVGMEKLPDIPEIPPEREMSSSLFDARAKSQSNTTVNEIVDFFETLDGDFLTESHRSLPLHDRLPKRRKSKLPRMIRTSTTTLNSKESLDSEGSMESKESAQSETIRRPKKPISKKPRRRTSSSVAAEKREMATSSQSDDSKESARPKLNRRVTAIPMLYTMQPPRKTTAKEKPKKPTKKKVTGVPTTPGQPKETDGLLEKEETISDDTAVSYNISTDIPTAAAEATAGTKPDSQNGSGIPKEKKTTKPKPVKKLKTPKRR
ncbi:short transient receptor potential channel 7-like isoform X4 [Apostichopus japonicus]|uniref:short transient receptor potential channel 7-like isoform X4 n=1 Tax=Stichopus japonicus TaxID=307972 RepID=UPI003AB1B76D